MNGYGNVELTFDNVHGMEKCIFARFFYWNDLECNNLDGAVLDSTENYGWDNCVLVIGAYTTHDGMVLMFEKNADKNK